MECPEESGRDGSSYAHHDNHDHHDLVEPGIAKGVGSPATATLVRPATSLISPSSHLEGLPVEIQRLIMANAASLQQLGALIRASPELHRVYAADRAAVLRHLLLQTLNGVLADAAAAHLSGTKSFQQARTEASLWAFLDAHDETWRATEPAARIIAQTKLSADDMVQLIQFHTAVVEPLAGRYVPWALSCLPYSSPDDAAVTCPPSETEKLRVQRALYRLQLFCNVCGSRGEGRSAAERIGGNLARVRVLSTFAPWEAEQMLCVHQFVRDVTEPVLRQAAWDLDEDRNPKHRRVDITAINEHLLLVGGANGDATVVNDRSHNAILRHGLSVVAEILKLSGSSKSSELLQSKSESQSESTEHDHYHYRLVEVIRDAVVTGMEGRHRGLWGDDWIDDCIWETTQTDRRERWYSRHDAAQDTYQRMPFEGDSTSIPDTPPLGWTLFWRGRCSSLFGAFVHSRVRRWGYVMWDAARLRAPGSRAAEDIETEWYSRYGDGENDPRWEFYDEGIIEAAPWLSEEGGLEEG